MYRQACAFGSSSTSTAGSAGLSISYEVDLFGANRAAEASAEAGYESQRFAFRALMLAVQADTAAGYLDLVAAREQPAVARARPSAQERVLPDRKSGVSGKRVYDSVG